MSSEVDPRILELRRRRQEAHTAGGKKRIARQHEKGKRTARERIITLFDPGTFNEIEPYTRSDPDAIPGEGVVTGYGLINGRTVYAYAQDFTVYGGTLSELQSQKICRVMDLAMRGGVPIVGLIDSGGARIQSGVRSLKGYAEIFKRNARYSGVIPQISILMGPCAGGAAYSPALTDLIIMVEKTGYLFLTGPDVIKAVTGEVVDHEALGGAEVHMALSGTSHLATPTEQEALELCRKVLGYLPPNNIENPLYQEPEDDPLRMDEELNSIVPLDPNQPYSMKRVIQHIVDRDTFLEIQPLFARNAIVGFARIGGHSVGIVAQEPEVMAGVMDIDCSDKITRFVRFCDAFNVPLVTLVDTPGFLPGVDQEHRGVVRHGAKVVFAYAESTVPKVSIITRKAYGGAYVVMSSKYLGSDVNLAWPSAEVAVMGAEGAVNITHKTYLAAIKDPEERKRERKRLIEEYRRDFSTPYQIAAIGGVDDIIEPRETRPRIIAALISLSDKHADRQPRKHGNMPV